MTKREFMEQQLSHMAEEGMVRKSDVISIVEKQKTLIHESDSLYESLKELKEEYHGTGEFVVDGNSYSIGQMMEELRNDTKIGRQFRKNVNKNILTYMMKFGGDEEQPSNSKYALRINMSEKEGKYIMQAEEFINIVYNSGYATKKNAKKYTEKHPKDSYSDQDFIDVYRFNEEKKEIDHTHCTMSPIMNGKTTAFRNGIRGNNSSGQDWIGQRSKIQR